MAEKEPAELKSTIDALEREAAEARAALTRLARMARRSRQRERLVWTVAAGLLVVAAAPAGTTVTAPFEVVGDDNNPLFKINSDPRGFSLFSSGGDIVGGGGALRQDTFFKVTTTDRSTQAAFGLVDGGSTPTLTLRFGGEESDRLSLAVVKDTPALNLTGKSGVNLINLTQGDTGGGYLQLSDQKGNAMAAAGVLEGGIGWVQALPNGSPGASILGLFSGFTQKLPGTFICGFGCADR